MSVAVAVLNDVTNGFLQHWDDGHRIHVIVTLTFSGNYSTGGDTTAFNLPIIKSNSVPIYVEIHGIGAYNYSYIPGTTIANGKTKIVSLATQAELGAGAYGAGVTGDTVVAHAIFLKYI